MDRQGTWAEVAVGSYLRDATGKAWKVAAISGNRVGLLDRAGVKAQVLRRPADTPVTLLHFTEREVSSKLGATPIAEKVEPSTVWTCPIVSVRNKTEFDGHMFLMHGIYTKDVKTPEGRKEAHDDSHADPDPDFVRKHTHRR